MFCSLSVNCFDKLPFASEKSPCQKNTWNANKFSSFGFLYYAQDKKIKKLELLKIKTIFAVIKQFNFECKPLIILPIDNPLYNIAVKLTPKKILTSVFKHLLRSFLKISQFSWFFSS